MEEIHSSQILGMLSRVSWRKKKFLFFSVKAHSGLKTLVCFWLYVEFPAGKCLSRDAFLHSSWQSLISMGTDPGICGFACWSAAAVAEHPEGNRGNRRPEPSSLLWYPEGVVPAMPAWIQPGQRQGVGSWPLESQDKGPYTAPHCPLCLNRLSTQTRVCLCWWSCCQALPIFFFFFLIWLTAKMIFVGTLCLFCTLLICCCVQPGEENPSQVLEHSCLRPSCCLGIGSFLRR